MCLPQSFLFSITIIEQEIISRQYCKKNYKKNETNAILFIFTHHGYTFKLLHQSQSYSLLHPDGEVSDDIVEHVEHDAGVAGGEGEAGPDPDGAGPAPAQVDPALPETGQDPVPQLRALHVDSTDRAAAPRCRQDGGEALLQLLQPGL